jgi:hypothetical protein
MSLAGSIAESRDRHYHNPPDYVVLEPEDTTSRTSNLQQTNTNGYKWQGTELEFIQAQEFVQNWGDAPGIYRSTSQYQHLLKQLLARYNYRLDTNFAKIDRIEHPKIEHFKTQVYDSHYQGITIKQWIKLLANSDITRIYQAFNQYLSIEDSDADNLVK